MLAAGAVVAAFPLLAAAQTEEAINMRMVQAGGVEIATQTFGSQGDPAVLLIMGATASMLGWPDALCEALAGEGLFVIRFDHRDTGRSTTVAPGEASYSVEDMAKDVIGILDSYDLQQATLMGMSLGGLIAQIVALTHPQRVRSLILVSSEPLGWDGAELPHISQAFLNHFGGLASLDWSDRSAVTEFLTASESLSSGAGQPFDEAYARTRIEEILTRTDSSASMFNHATRSTTEDWTGRFREIDCPTLVIHGDQDPILPVENGRAIAAGIEGAELVILDGVGHELPAAVLPQIVERAAVYGHRAR